MRTKNRRSPEEPKIGRTEEQANLDPLQLSELAFAENGERRTENGERRTENCLSVHSRHRRPSVLLPVPINRGCLPAEVLGRQRCVDSLLLARNAADRQFLEGKIKDHEFRLGCRSMPVVHDEDVLHFVWIACVESRGHTWVAPAEVLVIRIDDLIVELLLVDQRIALTGRHEDRIFSAVAIEVARDDRKFIEKHEIRPELGRNVMFHLWIDAVICLCISGSLGSNQTGEQDNEGKNAAKHVPSVARLAMLSTRKEPAPCTRRCTVKMGITRFVALTVRCSFPLSQQQSPHGC